MKILSISKDGGEYSKVHAYTLVEIKSLFSVILLKFDPGSRDAYHTHAFNCFNWLLRGKLMEYEIQNDGTITTKEYTPSIWGFPIYRKTYHKVVSLGTSYVLSFRGPWQKTWKEFLPSDNRELTLTHGRVEIE